MLRLGILREKPFQYIMLGATGVPSYVMLDCGHFCGVGLGFVCCDCSHQKRPCTLCDAGSFNG